MRKWLYTWYFTKIETYDDLNTKIGTRVLHRKVNEKFEYNYDLQRKLVSL